MPTETPIGLLFNIQRYSIHDGPGIRTTVFFKGCPLRCAWCSNPESQNPAPQMMGGTADSRTYTLPEVLAACLRDRAFYEESGGGVTLSGGEPLTQAGFAAALLQALQAEGIHTAMETTGCVAEDIFREAAPFCDLLLFDIKHHDSALHKQGTGANNKLILQNLHWAVQAGCRVLPRIPVIPGYNSSPADAAGFAALLGGLGCGRVQLLPFHQMGDRKYTLLQKHYALRGQKPLYPEDLTDYIAVFAKKSIDAFC